MLGGEGSKPTGSSVEGRVTRVRPEAVLVEERVGIKIAGRVRREGSETSCRVGF